MQGFGLLNRIGDFFVNPNYRQKARHEDTDWEGVVSALGLQTGKIGATDYAKQVKAYQGTVYACANLNATAVATNPVRLFLRTEQGRKPKWTKVKDVESKRKDYLFAQDSLQKYLRTASNVVEVVDHPVLTLLDGVNAFHNSFDLKEITSLFLDLTGNCYWYVPRNKLGVPSDIWVIFPQWMKPIPDKKLFISGYKYKKGSREIVFPESEIVHFKQVSPLSEMCGTGAVAGAAVAVLLYESMMEYESVLFRNMGRLDMAVIIKDASEDIRKRYEAIWRQAYGGLSKAGKFGVFSHDLDIREFGAKPRDMSYGMGRRYVREEICASFGVPVGMLTSESAYRTNNREARAQHATNAIAPRCIRSHEKLNEKLLPMYPDYDGSYFFASDNCVPEDEELEINKRTSYVQAGIMAINEARADIGLPAIPGLDLPYLPINQVPVGSLDNEETYNRVALELSKRIREKLANGA